MVVILLLFQVNDGITVTANFNITDSTVGHTVYYQSNNAVLTFCVITNLIFRHIVKYVCFLGNLIIVWIVSFICYYTLDISNR